MDVAHALRAGYHARISPEYKTYDAYSVPEAIQPPYVIISNIQVQQRQTGVCTKILEAFVTVDIVTKFTAPTGRTESWVMADTIESLINTTPANYIDLTQYGWSVDDTNLQSSGDLQSRENTSYIYRNIRTYRHLISRKNG